MSLTRRRLLFSVVTTSALVSFGIPRRLGALMIEPVNIAEQLMYCTARIVGKIPNSKDFKTGTGFFFNFLAEGGEQIPVLVTNKHVIEDTDGLQFLVHTSSTKDSKQPDANFAIQSVASDWIPHPNPKIDLCAVLVGPVMNAMQPLTPFFRALDPQLIKSDAQLRDLNAVEDVLMVGYPNGLWDSVNNFPLIRRGITASHPAIDFDVNGVPTTVVDVASFPGSSGSPVFVYNNGTIPDKQGHMALGARIIFLGILFSGPTYQPDGSIVIKNIPTVNVAVPQVNMMMNLGYIIKAREIAELGKTIFAKYSVKPPVAPITPPPSVEPAK